MQGGKEVNRVWFSAEPWAVPGLVKSGHSPCRMRPAREADRKHGVAGV